MLTKLTIDGVAYRSREEYETHLIATADEFAVVQFAGRGKFVRVNSFKTRAEAEARRDEIKRELPTVRLMVYAINRRQAREVSVLVS